MVINDGDGVDPTHSITSGLAVQQLIYNTDTTPPHPASPRPTPPHPRQARAATQLSLGSIISIAALQPRRRVRSTTCGFWFWS